MKTCAYCLGPIPRGHNYSTKKYCSRAHYWLGERAKGPERFWAKVDKSAGDAGCWLYMGFRKWDGYGWLGRKALDGRSSGYITAHRYAWILTNGEVPDGLHVLHQCDNPPCCNPAHMRLGTHQENMAEMRARGRNNSKQLKKYRPVLHPNRVRPERKVA